MNLDGPDVPEPPPPPPDREDALRERDAQNRRRRGVTGRGATVLTSEDGAKAPGSSIGVNTLTGGA